jgi:hypothetical protein
MNTDRTGSRRAGAWLLGLGFLVGPAALPANAQICPITNDASISGVVNTYYPGLGTVGAGDTSLDLDMNAARGAGEGLAVGDLLLVIQMQDADITSTNNSSYGDGVAGGAARGQTAINRTGLYEFVVAQTAAAVGSGANVTVTVTGDGAGNGTINSYRTAGRTGNAGQRTYQVVKVARYRNVTLNGVTAAAWNGVTGGVVAIDAAGTATLAANAVNVTALGFRGGLGQQLSGDGGLSGTDYRRPSNVDAHGLKGEGIAGTAANLTGVGATQGYPPAVGGNFNGDRARGAPGNAGGGGTDSNPSANDENSGGGGGANGGQGGDGGRAWDSNDPVGGYGGAAFPATFARLVMGGGGGAGSRNNSSGVQSSGASGGGIVFVRAGGVAGAGTITADGGSANAFQPANDGGGGGGAGGSVLVVAPATVSLAGLTVLARGGQGSDAWPTQPPNGNPGERHGPGGGGGGGAIFVSAAISAASTAAGGANGTTTTADDPYGATSGAFGTGGLVSFAQIPGVETCLAVTRAVISGVRLTGRQLEFAVTSGRGVAALNVIGEMHDGRRRRLNREALRPVTADALGPMLFEVTLFGRVPRKIWIEERERTGRIRMLGPYVPGDERQEAAYAGLEERARRSEVREGPQSRMLVRPRVGAAPRLDGAAVRGPESRPPRRAAGIKIEVGRGGLVRVPLDEWLAVASGAASAGSGPLLAQRIQVTNLGRSIPFDIRDRVLEFHAEALSTDYTGRNVYLVTWGVPQAPRADLTRSGFPREEGWRRVEENVLYAAFAAQGADPWIWDFALEGQNGPFAFDLADASPTKASVPLRIGLIGATEHVHTVRAEMNGVSVGEVVFSGKTMGVLRGGIPGDALRATGNELRLTYEAEASTPDDPGLVFLDVVDLMAPEREGEAEVLAVTGYDPSLPVLAGVDYLIVTHRDFKDAAERLRALKEGDGLRVAVVDVERAYDRYSAGVFEANAVRELVREAASRKRLAYVVLLGDDTFDPRDFLGLGSGSRVPSLYGWDGVFGRVPSETLFADVDDDGRPDVAIGRLPVRTAEEAQAVVDKIARQGQRRRGHLLVADEERESDISFRGEADALASRLPEGSVTMADVGAQGVAAARATLLEGLRRGPATASYFGHGGEDVWSDQSLLRNADVASLEGTGEETVLFSWTCETQWFVAEGRTISEELLLVPNGGTVASVGPTGISDPALQVNLARRVYDYFLAGASLGEAVRRAKAEALLADPGLAPVVHGFGLLGDPALTLPRAR